MADLVNIRLNDARLLPFECSFKLTKNQPVVVEFADGICEFGIFVCTERNQIEALGKVLHIASEKDIAENKRLLSFEKEDKEKVLQRVKALNIKLKLVSVLRSFDGKKILIMYTADDRVDFRQLVRDLAGIFRMRVEMRQINEREEAKFIGGCGQCGQPLCCRRFLGCQKQTSIKMAKTQGISLTPSKVNGLCGKLMCCLQYEYPCYKEAKEKLPPIGSIVETDKGQGEVVDLDLLNELIVVKLKNEAQLVEKFTKEQIKVLSKATSTEENDE